MAQTVTNIAPVPTGGYRVVGAINGEKVSLLLDTGAAVTLLRKDTWDRVTTNCSQKLTPWPAPGLVGADGSPLETQGSAHVTLELSGNLLPLDVVVVSSLTSEGILGLDFLRMQKASINLEKAELHLAHQKCTLPLCRPTAQSVDTRVKVHATSTVEVPAYSELEVMACLEKPVSGGTWLLETLDSFETKPSTSLLVARALVHPTPTHIPVRLLNSTAGPTTVYAGQSIGYIESVEFPEGPVNTVTSGEPDGATDEQCTILKGIAEESDLSVGEKEIFYNFLVSYADVMATSTADLGRTTMLRHTIDTGDAAPIRQPVRRISPCRREEVCKLLDEMLKNGVVEQSASP